MQTIRTFNILTKIIGTWQQNAPKKIMIKKILSIMKYPIPIFMGIVTYNQLIGLDSYRIPMIVKPLINLFRWKFFFIICSIIVAGAIFLTFMLALDETKNA